VAYGLRFSSCKRLDLIGGKVIATDGTKLRTQNSKKNNYNQKKIDEHLAYIENKLHEYLDALDIADTAETMGLDPDIDKEKIKEKIARLNDKKQHYQRLEQQLTETGQEQISTTDPDSRKLAVRQNILEVCYNIQASVDDYKNEVYLRIERFDGGYCHTYFQLFCPISNDKTSDN
jgi:hypothetical protein